jgi:uncharacterized YccA/Bax inhibitor family protein
MNLAIVALLSAAGVFLGMLVFYEVGRRTGAARLGRDPDGVSRGSGPVEAAVFGLLGLLLAFSFSGAASRFEARRHLVAEEANAIGTAYLRIDVLPADAQPAIRQLFRRYLDVRVQAYSDVSDLTAHQAKLAEGEALQGQIWAAAAAACRRPEAVTGAVVVMLPALNAMIDITTTRLVASLNHPPTIIFVLLAALSLVSAALVGYDTSSTKRRSWFHMMILAAAMSVTFYVILDLEHPRLGLIRVDSADQVLMDVGKMMR